MSRRIDFWLVLVAVVLFFGFTRPVYEGATLWLQALIGALLGAVVTVLVTSFLLRQQSEHQESLMNKQTAHQEKLLEKTTIAEAAKENAAKVFEEKLKSYTEFLTTLEQVTRDGSLNQEEVRRIVFQVGRLKMLSRVENVAKVSELLAYIFLDDFKTGPQRRNKIESDLLAGSVLSMVSVFRRELFEVGASGSTEASVSSEPDRRFELNLPPGWDAEVWISDLIKKLDPAVSDGSSSLDMEEDSDPPQPRGGGSGALAAQPGEWTGESSRIFYANTGGRNWEDMRQHGYWTCGGGARYRDQALTLRIGDEICAYVSGRGYVGLGVVRAPAVELQLHPMNGAPLHADTERNIRTNPGKLAEEREFAVAVHWTKSLTEGSPGWRGEKMFASPMTLCRLRDPGTLAMLRTALAPTNRPVATESPR